MRLRTIGLIITLALGMLAAPLPTEAQKAGKMPRIGFLAPRSAIPKEFKQGLRELGYIEGKNIIMSPDLQRASSIGFLDLLQSWFDSKLTSLRRCQHRLPERPRRQLLRSPSSCWRVAIW